MFEIFQLIDIDTLRINNDRIPYVCTDVTTIVHELMELSYEYEANLAHTPEKTARRNLIITRMNLLLAGLWRYCIPFLNNAKGAKQNRFDMYMNFINYQILLNERNFRRDETVTDEVYESIRDYGEEIIALTKAIHKDPEYKYDRVPRYVKANNSKAEFLRRAYELNRYTMSQIHGVSVAYRELCTEELFSLSSDILYYCYRANYIFPLCKEEYEERTEYLKQAETSCKYFEKVLFHYFVLANIPRDTQNKWGGKYDDCHRLINGLMKSDRNRFGKLKPKAEIPNYDQLCAEREAGLQKYKEEKAAKEKAKAEAKKKKKQDKKTSDQ